MGRRDGQGLNPFAPLPDGASGGRGVPPEWAAPAAEYGELQRLVDAVFEDAPGGMVSRMDLVLRAQLVDLPDDLAEVVELMPSGSYTRPRLCDQMNSIITAHGWGSVYGTVQ
ncbi:hypothetical protein HMPREF1008_00976 [Olsenella sp. oral taxon 809 str. F0356]|uniref:hypothetical protein n=1 Tax=Olsenella sp. oral taxon 809 TaxID=661086 RepID=UPI000231F086|nr:hypothetical protein HMPREF1008_00976 [Olsenella sp. oral taxon 809 str. F0356]